MILIHQTFSLIALTFAFEERVTKKTCTGLEKFIWTLNFMHTPGVADEEWQLFQKCMAIQLITLTYCIIRYLQLLKSHADLNILDCSLVLSQRKTFFKTIPEIKDGAVSIGKAVYST